MSYDYINAQSWIPIFESLFSEVPIRKAIEFGEGDGTQWLLDHCDKVVSVEVISKEYHRGWAEKCRKMYGDNPKWVQEIYECDSLLIGFDELCRLGFLQNTEDIQLECLKSVEDMVNKALRLCPDVDLVFVDPGVHFRTVILNTLFRKFEREHSKDVIFAAHDTNVNGVYGWECVRPPVGYSGTTKPMNALLTTIWRRM